jgi:hypothetical protein
MKTQLSIQQELEAKLASLQERFALSVMSAPVYVAPAIVEEVAIQQTTKQTMNKPQTRTVVVPADYTAPMKKVVEVPADFTAPKQIDSEWVQMTVLATSLSGLDLDYPHSPIEGQKEKLAKDLKAALAAGRKAIRQVVKSFKLVEATMTAYEIAVAVAQIKNLEVAAVEAALQVSQANFVYVEVAAAPAVVTVGSVGSINTSVEKTAVVKADIRAAKVNANIKIEEIEVEMEEATEIAQHFEAKSLDLSSVLGFVINQVSIEGIVAFIALNESYKARKLAQLKVRMNLKAKLAKVRLELATTVRDIKAVLAGRIRIRRTSLSNVVTINETGAQFRARALEELLHSLMTAKQAAKQAKAQANKAEKAPKAKVDKSVSQAERKAAHKAAIKEAKALKTAKQSAFRAYRASISEAKSAKVAKAATVKGGKKVTK